MPVSAEDRGLGRESVPYSNPTVTPLTPLRPAFTCSATSAALCAVAVYDLVPERAAAHAGAAEALRKRDERDLHPADSGE